MTNKFSIGYHKKKHIDLKSLEQTFSLEGEDNYNPFIIDKIQNYNPIYDILFTLSSKNFNSIQLNHKYHIENLNTVSDISSNPLLKDVFIKYSPLLDPVRYMVGKYTSNSDIIHNLPYPDNISIDISHNCLLYTSPSPRD